MRKRDQEAPELGSELEKLIRQAGPLAGPTPAQLQGLDDQLLEVLSTAPPPIGAEGMASGGYAGFGLGKVVGAATTIAGSGLLLLTLSAEGSNSGTAFNQDERSPEAAQSESCNEVSPSRAAAFSERLSAPPPELEHGHAPQGDQEAAAQQQSEARQEPTHPTDKTQTPKAGHEPRGERTAKGVSPSSRASRGRSTAAAERPVAPADRGADAKARALIIKANHLVERGRPAAALDLLRGAKVPSRTERDRQAVVAAAMCLLPGKRRAGADLAARLDFSGYLGQRLRRVCGLDP